MRDVEVKLNSFKLKKLAALAMCAVMAIGVMIMPVNAEGSSAKKQTGDIGYTGDAPGNATGDAVIATGDAKDPEKVIDFIKNHTGEEVRIELNEELQTMPKSVFQAAKDAGKNLTFINENVEGHTVQFTFNQGIKNIVDMNFALTISADMDIVKNLKNENALVFEFAHEGVLPGPMEVQTYSEVYKDQEKTTAFLYLLNETTGKLEKQEQAVTIDRGWVTFTITHCSSYVTTLTEIEEAKLQVADAKTETKAPAKNDANPIVAAGAETNAFQTIALLTLCGAAIVIATKKEKKVQ